MKVKLLKKVRKIIWIGREFKSDYAFCIFLKKNFKTTIIRREVPEAFLDRELRLERIKLAKKIFGGQNVSQEIK